ncbi:MAG: thioredoxin domain-containing protein [Ectothiorhodospiraceae bacterium]|nr:thioredoxin domain-containing protein [Ectothiorhodospiraceae bacterium]
MSTERPHRNALADETSPYLRQHADNPVDWLPWNEAALARARRENRPILLSIGYSACHWCHVMAHESFEHEPTARLMNELFVNIKVDREERPDLDKIYQLAHQLLARRAGGWPLTVFLTPDDHAPFFAGTYFPREPRHGMPAFRDVLTGVARAFAEQRDAISQQNASLIQALRDIDGATRPGSGSLDARPLDLARAALVSAYDARNGGFGGAPKFPHPTNLERLLREHARLGGTQQGETPPLAIVHHTLRRMAESGIYDQLGGGFCRYAVDAQWMIPHFEKMLYDNGPLLVLACETWQVTGDPLLERVARETADWVMREMQSPEGGYWSTLDADSEGEEGKFYVWDREAVEALLEPAEMAVVGGCFGLDRTPNFEGRHWHLHTFRALDEVAASAGMDLGTARAHLDAGRAKLLAHRATRVWPGRDEKVLTAWNGLMIRAMASAGRVLGEPALVASAERAFDFVRDNLLTAGGLQAVHKDGRARFPAYLDDHAFLIDAALALLQCRWRSRDLAMARQLADTLIARFEDPHAGGFYFTAHDHERLVHRPRSFMDDALPAGNGIAAWALGRLGHLLGETRYLEAAERAVRAAWTELGRVPHAHNAMLLALEELLDPPQTVVIRGSEQAMARWHARATRAYAPRRLTIAIPADAVDLPDLLAARAPVGEVVAYVCHGQHCDAPIVEEVAFDAAMAATEVPRGAA